MPVRTAAFGAALLPVGVALFQAALAFGVPWGSAAYGGAAAGPDGVLPTGLRFSSAVATVVLMLAAWIILIRGGVVGAGVLNDRLVRWAAWGIVGFLTLNTGVVALRGPASSRGVR